MPALCQAHAHAREQEMGELNLSAELLGSDVMGQATSTFSISHIDDGNISDNLPRKPAAAVRRYSLGGR